MGLDEEIVNEDLQRLLLSEGDSPDTVYVHVETLKQLLEDFERARHWYWRLWWSLRYRSAVDRAVRRVRRWRHERAL